MDDSSMVAPRTCVLKVYLHCPGCERKVYKVLQKITGVTSIAIEGEQGKVTVSGAIDPYVLQKALAKIKKRAEILWDSGGSMNRQTTNQNHYIQAHSTVTHTPEFDLEQLDQLSKIERVKQVEVTHTKTTKITFMDDKDDDFNEMTVVHHQLCSGCGGGPGGATTQSCCCHKAHNHMMDSSYNYYGGSAQPPADGCSYWGPPGCAPSAPPLPGLPPPRPAAKAYPPPSVFIDENPNNCMVM